MLCRPCPPQDVTGQISVLRTLRILIACGLALIGLCDLVAFVIIFLARPAYIQIGRLRCAAECNFPLADSARSAPHVRAAHWLAAQRTCAPARIPSRRLSCCELLLRARKRASGTASRLPLLFLLLPEAESGY